jgi:prepilin-type N-terminal cleavage/methylation domain-containing protein
MRVRGHRWGFTLIEMMISIAILAILGSIAVSSLFQFTGISRQRDHSRALHEAEGQIFQLRQTSFDSLPPEVETVGENGTVNLAQRNLVAGSVKVRTADDLKEFAPQSVSLENGTITLGTALKGRRVIVDYRFSLPTMGEAHFLGSDGIRLENTPVRKIEAVYLASADKLTKTSAFTLQGDLLKVKAAKGQLVVVDYLGGAWSNQVSGRFLDPSLQSTAQPSDTKMLTVEEPYRGPFRLTLPLLKVRR